jgi:hypothetical protein
MPVLKTTLPQEQLWGLERRLEQAGIGDPSQPLPGAGVGYLICKRSASPSAGRLNTYEVIML